MRKKWDEVRDRSWARAQKGVLQGKREDIPGR